VLLAVAHAANHPQPAYDFHLDEWIMPAAQHHVTRTTPISEGLLVGDSVPAELAGEDHGRAAVRARGWLSRQNAAASSEWDKNAPRLL
jgi:hypothetical protein